MKFSGGMVEAEWKIFILKDSFYTICPENSQYRSQYTLAGSRACVYRSHKILCVQRYSYKPVHTKVIVIIRACVYKHNLSATENPEYTMDKYDFKEIEKIY